MVSLSLSFRYSSCASSSLINIQYCLINWSSWKVRLIIRQFFSCLITKWQNIIYYIQAPFRRWLHREIVYNYKQGYADALISWFWGITIVNVDWLSKVHNVKEKEKKRNDLLGLEVKVSPLIKSRHHNNEGIKHIFCKKLVLF